MENAQRSQELQVSELAAVRHCVETLELPPAVRQQLTAALDHSEAQVRQRLARGASLAQHSTLLGDLAAQLMHEVRNPLNAIYLHADVLEEELRRPTADSAEQMAASIADVRAEVQRLYDIVQDYLALARLAVIERTAEDLGAFLRVTLHDLQEQATSLGITLRLEGLTRLGRVHLHRSTFQHALQHLAHYALHATPRGATLTLRGRRSAQLSTLLVHYPGEPIPEEQLPMVFEPFQSPGPTLLGLGLYVVRAIILAHHGTIEVSSPPDKGVTFTITLPLMPPAPS